MLPVFHAHQTARSNTPPPLGHGVSLSSSDRHHIAHTHRPARRCFHSRLFRRRVCGKNDTPAPVNSGGGGGGRAARVARGWVRNSRPGAPPTAVFIPAGKVTAAGETAKGDCRAPAQHLSPRFVAKCRQKGHQTRPPRRRASCGVSISTIPVTITFYAHDSAQYHNAHDGAQCCEL